MHSGAGSECPQHLDRIVQGNTSALAVQPAGHVDHHRPDAVTQPRVTLGDLPLHWRLSATPVSCFAECELGLVALAGVRDHVLEGSDRDPDDRLVAGAGCGGVERCDAHDFAFRQSH